MSRETEVGWGETMGFRVTQMDEGQLIYCGAPSIRQHMAVVFTTTQNLEGGGLVEVLVPEVYKLSCHPADGFKALSLKNYEACDDSGQGLRLALNDTLTPGQYSFTVGVTNPAYTPPYNKFDILLYDRDGRVVDARMQIEGQYIISGLYVRHGLIAFDSSEAFAQAVIQITLRVNAPLDPYLPVGAIRAIQVAVPERFTLVTKVPVKNLDGLVTPEVNWYHLYYADRLVRIDISRTDSEAPKTIPANDYRFQFQVRIPEFWMPAVNVWLLSLCRNIKCTEILATMPIGGFDHDAKPALSEGGDGLEAGAAIRGEPALAQSILQFLMVTCSWFFEARHV
jgi:hypothetical protein